MSVVITKWILASKRMLVKKSWWNRVTALQINNNETENFYHICAVILKKLNQEKNKK